MSMCPICEQYLCYVHNIVWISNFRANFVQISVQINQLKKKREGLKSPWTRKFSGRGDITSVSSLEQGRLVQEDDEVKTLDKTKWFCPRPAHGRVNIPHVQPKNEWMFYTSNPWTRKCLRKFKLPKQDSSNPWTRMRRINLLRHQNNPTYGWVKGVNSENQ